jgi:hypothetical protein
VISGVEQGEEVRGVIAKNMFEQVFCCTIIIITITIAIVFVIVIITTTNTTTTTTIIYLFLLSILFNYIIIH